MNSVYTSSILLVSLACNQAVYDQIYETLILDTIKTQDFNRKNNTIEVLRSLCHNQKFSLEKGKRGKRGYKNTASAKELRNDFNGGTSR